MVNGEWWMVDGGDDRPAPRCPTGLRKAQVWRRTTLKSRKPCEVRDQIYAAPDFLREDFRRFRPAPKEAKCRGKSLAYQDSLDDWIDSQVQFSIAPAYAICQQDFPREQEQTPPYSSID